MTKLKELIKKLCPYGVECKTLNEVTKWDKKFNSIKNNYDKNYFHVSADVLKKIKKENGTVKLLSTGNFEGYALKEEAIKFLNKGEIFTIPSGGSANIKYYNGEFVDSGNLIGTSYDNNLYNTKYIYYFLENSKELLQSYFRGSGVKHPAMNEILNISIPVPPMEVQNEIVHILDDFTLLSAELSAELKARKKQYNFYLNYLMTFDENEVDYKSVGELFEIKNGLNKEKSAFGKGTPIVNFTDVFNNRWLKKDSFKGLVEVSQEEIERYKVNKGDVFFTRTSETKEEIGMACTVIDDIPNCVFSGFVLRARPTTDLLLPKFCAYYFSTNRVRDTIIRYASFTTRATTTGPKLSKIMVPILSKEKQQEIVDILDNLDKLCNDISEGLPAEIEARKKQYEYYRDKLLTFKELKVES